eukprot:153240-Chlamydomonas_euryale.AAC.1
MCGRKNGRGAEAGLLSQDPRHPASSCHSPPVSVSCPPPLSSAHAPSSPHPVLGSPKAHTRTFGAHVPFRSSPPFTFQPFPPPSSLLPPLPSTPLPDLLPNCPFTTDPSQARLPRL